MMFRSPIYNFPVFYNKHNYYNNKKNNYYINHNKCENELTSNNIQKERKKETEYFFDLFGIHLYFDDILLICLILFLYNEGVKDEGLFIALILLLLT